MIGADTFILHIYDTTLKERCQELNSIFQTLQLRKKALEQYFLSVTLQKCDFGVEKNVEVC